MSALPPRIRRGHLLVYRLFDVAEEVQMSQLEQLLRASRGPDRFRVPRFIDRGIVVKRPPVSFDLGSVALPLPGPHGQELRAEVLCKIRDIGVLSLIYQIPIPENSSFDDLIALGSRLEEGTEIDTLAQAQAAELVKTIEPALLRPTAWSTFEDYLIYSIEELSTDLPLRDLLTMAPVAELLLAEDKLPIATATRQAILENAYQYSERDLTLVEWNSALVIDPAGGRDIPDILEFALTQLLEMRYYDDLLDLKLARLYDDIERKRTGIWKSRFDRSYKEGSARYIEFSEFTERVENSLKVVGDFYLATVYRAATRRFRLADWQQNVTRKMNILAQVTSLLQGEINNRRSHLLEIIIILLIAYEIFSALGK